MNACLRLDDGTAADAHADAYHDQVWRARYRAEDYFREHIEGPEPADGDEAWVSAQAERMAGALDVHELHEFGLFRQLCRECRDTQMTAAGSLPRSTH